MTSGPTRRTVIGGLAGATVLGAAGLATWWTSRPRPPNVVLVMTDDQGYNDLGCYYTPPDPEAAYGPIQTPRLDQLAAEGVRLTQFYVAASVCTTSRAALLTGCYPPRVGFGAKAAGIGVLSPRSRAGLNPSELTMGERFQQAGYRTACIGKWHLGHQPPFLPRQHGFDEFFGIPWSANQRPLPLLRNETLVRPLPGRPVLVRQFTEAAIDFVDRHRRAPFFLYLAYSAPHEPWAVLPEFRGRSGRGLYRDVIEMVDHFVGTLVDAIDAAGLREDTLIVFTSDNGPWLEPRRGGSAFPLRGGKADVWEGGFRSPCLWRWPGSLPAGVTSDALITSMDLLPTFATLAGAPPPSDALEIDGHDVWPVLAEGSPSPTKAFFYYSRGRLEAVRNHRFKLVFANDVRTPPIERALFDLERDIGETTDVSGDHPDEVQALERLASSMREQLGDDLTETEGTAVRRVGLVPEEEVEPPDWLP